uniref:Uncharacterized protein n=1 Tax=Romanomermis culicivorax TaxID=13658 RepID=A0A915KY33_ROMCU
MKKKSRDSQWSFSRGQSGVSRVRVEGFTPPSYVHQWCIDKFENQKDEKMEESSQLLFYDVLDAKLGMDAKLGFFLQH